MPNDIKVGLHKVSHEIIGVFAGEGQFYVIGIDPDSPNFQKQYEHRILEKLSINKGGGKSSYWNDKTDLITDMTFDENNGIILTFFCGYFWQFEPMNFKDRWICDTNNKIQDKTKSVHEE